MLGNPSSDEARISYSTKDEHDSNDEVSETVALCHDEWGTTYPQPKKHRTVPLWAFITSVSIALTFFILAVLIHKRSVGSQVAAPHCQCSAQLEYDFSGYQCAPLGAPPDIARRRGCELDQFSLHWYPAERFEDNDTIQLMTEFTEMDWPRYYDREAQHKIDVFNPADKQAWVSKKEHLWHCGYLLMQTHLWITKGFDPPVNYEHTEHCTRTLLETIERNPPPDLDDIKANIETPNDPEHWPLIKPYYPCLDEGLFCKSTKQSV